MNELTKERFALGSLKNARFSFGQEISEVEQVGTSVIKAISGGDYVSSDVKNRDRIRFKGWTKLVFKGNAIPRFADNSWGFKRRFVEIILPYKFVPFINPDEPNQRLEDPDILTKITTLRELSGLLNLIMVRLPEIIKSRRIDRKEALMRQ